MLAYVLYITYSILYKAASMTSRRDVIDVPYAAAQLSVSLTLSLSLSLDYIICTNYININIYTMTCIFGPF